MERLTKRISGYAHGAEGITKDKLTGSYCRGQFEATACIDKLAEYEDLEEQGRLLRLPCKVGDMVYIVHPDASHIAKAQVNKIEVKPSVCGKMCYLIEYVRNRGCLYRYFENDFGKTIFLTQKEAESALKETENQKHEI